MSQMYDVKSTIPPPALSLLSLQQSQSSSQSQQSMQPPQPPQPPQLSQLLLSSSTQEYKLNTLDLNTNKLSKINESQLDLAIKRLFSFNDNFSKIFYMSNTYVMPQLQNGPKCGLVALSIATSVNENFVNVDHIFKTATLLGLTKQGEIFSAESLALLAEKCCSFKTKIIKNGLTSHLHCIVKSLLKKHLVLVPYDADFNHSPCCKKGFKAHWAIVTGFLIVQQNQIEMIAENNDFVILNSRKCSTLCSCIDSSDDVDLPLTISVHQGKTLIEKKSSRGIHDRFNEGEIYLICMQGKSRHIGLWLFDEMADSNDNLSLFSSVRDSDDYVLPEGGLEEGLKGKAIILDYS